MPIEDILARIDADAAKAMEQSRTAADSQKCAILGEAQAAVEKILAAARAEAQQHAAVTKERLVSAARLEGRNRLLAEKQKLISLAFEKTLESVQRLPDDKYRRLILSLLLKYVDRGDETAVVSERDAVRLGGAFIDEANKEVERAKSPSGKSRKGHLKLITQKEETGGGFVLRSGRTELNITFPAMLKAVRDRMESDVAGTLFG
ncbi:MAG: V-type ATP synthase subunit E [Planctomycetota bacterium]|nr:V-type ATP synthase subunit E [Planctomycetota bacterium]